MKYFLLFFFLIACGESEDEKYERKKKEAWNEDCKDTSVLLATTTGSPSYYTCPNKNHLMKVQVASQEFGALVFCECKRN